MILEQKFITTSNYVALDKANFDTYSNEFAFLLQAIGAELDNFFKVYCGFNASKRKNIKDYAVSILASYPDVTSQKINVIGTNIELIPFAGWVVAASAQSLSWWNAFDTIKHNRQGTFSNANQKNVINILAALYLLEMKQFSKVAKQGPEHLEEPDNPDEKSKLFSLEGWNLRYVKIGDNLALVDDTVCCLCEV